MREVNYNCKKKQKNKTESIGTGQLVLQINFLGGDIKLV